MMNEYRNIDQILASLNQGQGYPPVVSPKRRVKKRFSQRLLRRWTWDAYDMNCKNMSDGKMDNEKVFIGASDFSDYLVAKIYDERKQNGISTHHKSLKVITNRLEWTNYVNTEFDGDHIIQFNDGHGIVIIDNLNFFKYSCSSNSCDIDVHGDIDFNDNIEKFILKDFDRVLSYIEWMYSTDGSSVSVPLNIERLPIDEMYPFLGEEKLVDYYDRFLNSNANILLLIGPPGTGKTTFIRGLLAHSKSSAVVTYDASILEKDFVFARFIEDEASIMVLEDSDNFLKARSNGNTMMHRFLNVGDGLVTTKGKKLIFSTNLPSIRDVDQALVRPGRCFDILHFEQLDLLQAKALADKLEVKLPIHPRGHETKKYSIAEIFNEKQQDVPKSTGTFGFI